MVLAICLLATAAFAAKYCPNCGGKYADMDGETVWKGDYMPFGEDITPQVHWGNDYTYLGNEDDGGLMYFNARYYAKEVGRF
jgi:hypothetical protein